MWQEKRERIKAEWRTREQLPVASWKQRQGWAGEAPHNIPTSASVRLTVVVGLPHPAASRSCLTLLSAIVPAADAAFVSHPSLQRLTLSMAALLHLPSAVVTEAVTKTQRLQSITLFDQFLAGHSLDCWTLGWACHNLSHRTGTTYLSWAWAPTVNIDFWTTQSSNMPFPRMPAWLYTSSL